jgi:hypothetical protein
MIVRKSLLSSPLKTRLLLLFIAGVLSAGALLFVNQSSLAQRKITRRVSNSGGARREAPVRRTERAREQDNKVGQGKRTKPPVQRGQQVGVPSTGGPGIERSTEEIMLVQSYAPPSRRPALMPEREMREREDLPQDPNSPRDAGTAGKLGLGSKVRNIANLKDLGEPLAPQTVGTNFTGRGLDSGSVVVMVNSLPVTVEGTTIETPPAQASGGGWNSSYGRSLVSGTIINTPIAPGQTVNVQFSLGVMQTGTFRFFFNIEALP